MRNRRVKDVRSWLAKEPPLDELIAAYPLEWEVVRRDVANAVANGDSQTFRQYVAKISQRSRPSQHGEQAQLASEIRQTMALAAVRRICISTATGVTSGRIRFNLLNGWIAQKLLFRKDLERKPASAFWFRALWPLLWQRKYLMILVQPKGIYCFYSKQLIKELKALIGGRSCLEIAAGDGTLTRFLNDAGESVIATDDHSWTKTVSFPAEVQREDARTALRKHQPEVVICSWPPAGNAFEEEVFRTPSVQTYIVISSKLEFGSGNWNAYRSQQQFTFEEAPKLSKLVLPPEINPAVYVFQRTAQ